MFLCLFSRLWLLLLTLRPRWLNNLFDVVLLQHPGKEFIFCYVMA